MDFIQDDGRNPGQLRIAEQPAKWADELAKYFGPGSVRVSRPRPYFTTIVPVMYWWIEQM